MKYIIFFVLLEIISAQLVFIQETFRHGARYPNHHQFNNHSYHLLGELTSVGKRMHYLLGKKLYYQYWKKLNLPDYYDSRYFFVKSTDYNRTIQSAQSHIFGLLQQVQSQQMRSSEYSLPEWLEFKTLSRMWVQNKQITNFYGMPIHVERKGLHKTNFLDFLLNYEYASCLKQHEWSEQNLQSKYYKTMEPLITKYCKFLQEEYKIPFCNLTNIRHFVDVYNTNVFLGKSVHSIFNDEKSKKELIFLYTQGIYALYFLQQIQINATITPFLIATRDNLFKTVSLKSSQKWVIFSAHDHLLMNILRAMDLVNPECVQQQFFENQMKRNCIWQYPPYASNLIVQLEKEERNYFVRVRYNGFYMNLSFCKNAENCTFEQFQKFLNDTILENYQNICEIIGSNNVKNNQQNYDSSYQHLTKLVSFFLFMDVIYLIYCAISFYLNYRRKDKNIEHHNLQFSEHQVQMQHL